MTPATAKIEVSPAVVSVSGIVGFWLSGSVSGQTVVAQWDGAVLSVSQPLYARALLTVAIDAMFVDTPYRRGGRRFTLAGRVTDVVLTLAWSCDVVDVVEYSRGGVRRAVIAVADGSARAIDVGVARRAEENAPHRRLPSD